MMERAGLAHVGASGGAGLTDRVVGPAPCELLATALEFAQRCLFGHPEPVETREHARAAPDPDVAMS